MKTSVSPTPDEEGSGLACVIGLTQFVFMALGLMILTILVKVSTVTHQVTPLADFLTTHRLWLVIVPLLWGLLAVAFTRLGPVASRIVNTLGVLLAIAIGIIFTAAILQPVG